MIDPKDGALAFGLTCGAGMATTIGAAVVFNKTLIHYANNKALAVSLAFSAGVMLYVSFVEIFAKSRTGFEDAGYSDGMAYVLCTSCFFLGIFFGNLLDILVHKINGEVADHHEVIDVDALQAQLEHAERAAAETNLETMTSKDNFLVDADVEMNSSSSSHPHTRPPSPDNSDNSGSQNECMDDPSPVSKSDDSSVSSQEDSNAHLVKMGLMTALAIGIHNFPEGLATFVGTLDDPIVGFGLAVAIAIHNIPEGLCVAIPIYYATRDRWQAFKWAFISGISEPIGAGLGWAILYRVMDDIAYGVVFGLVAGMMVNICIHELLPTAFKYDPEDSVVTKTFILGMAVMALSLVLFQVI